MTRLVRALALVVLVGVGAVLVATAIADRTGPSDVAAPATASPTRSPEPSAVPTTGPLLPVHLYFPRSGLPPADATVLVAGLVPDRPEGRILRRLGALQYNVRAADIPAGATDPMARIAGRTQTTSAGNTQTFLNVSARLDGDVATVEFELGDWGVRTVEEARALVQQLVYTITDESNIRRAKVIEKGKDHALILSGGAGAGYAWNDPLTREDVFGYPRPSPSARPLQAAGDQGSSLRLSTSFSTDQVAPGLLRFVIAVDGLPRQHYPDFSVSAYGFQTLMPNAHAELEITVPRGEDTTTQAAMIDHTPLRSIAVGSPVTFRARVYRLGLDDQRPWRAVVLFDPTRIVIDVGGPPGGISTDGETLVYAPLANAEVPRTFSVSGVVRAFEATFSWRVRDAGGAVVSGGFGKANIGTSPVWGAYDVDVSIPATAQGALTLEVFQLSPKDGTETSLVKLPLRIAR
jgi:hypothetical protein